MTQEELLTLILEELKDIRSVLSANFTKEQIVEVKNRYKKN